MSSHHIHIHIHIHTEESEMILFFVETSQFEFRSNDFAQQRDITTCFKLCSTQFSKLIFALKKAQR